MFLKSIEGEYEPSFFIIRLRTDHEIDVAVDKNIATFMHEYIHFLQDLILPYCIRENLVRLGTFFDHIERAHSQGAIRLPVAPLDGANLTTLQTTMTWGGGAEVGSVLGITDVRVQDTLVAEYGFRIYQYDLILNDGTSYQFGARDLLEYIACKIESRHFPDQPRLADLPYYSVDLLVSHYGAACLNDFKRIALAEYCLLNDNPGHRLIQVLGKWQTSVINDLATWSDEQFVEFLKQAHWHSKGVPFETITEKLDRQTGELRNFFQYRFPQNSFPAIHLWLERAIDFARSTLAGRSFFAELFASESPHFNETMTKVLAEIGIPLIVNNQDEMGASLGGGTGKRCVCATPAGVRISRLPQSWRHAMPIDCCLRAR